MQQIIDLNPVEPAKMGFRVAAGTALDVVFKFRDQSGAAPLVVGLASLASDNLQLVLRPKSKRQAYGYDITVTDEATGTARVTIPGTVINEDCHVEMYRRDAEGHPLALIAKGHLYLTGAAYEIEGPLGPASYPTGPAGIRGPQGQQGEVGPQGVRGGTWTTGNGNPTIPGVVDGDMYLANDSGNVWRWGNGTWTRGSF